MQRRWLAPSVVGLWLAGCGFFGFPEPERASDGDGGSSPGGATSGSSGSSGSSAGDPATGGDGGANQGGKGGSTSGAAGDAEGGGAGAGEGGTAGRPTGGTAGRPTGGTAGMPTGGTAGMPTGGTAGMPTGGSAGKGGSSGQGPTLPVMSDLSIWLDANDVAGQGPAIASWPNRATAESDATQPALGQRPLVMTVDGRNGVGFDGARSMVFGAGFENFTLGLTFFAVARVAETGACNELLQFSNGQEVDDMSFQQDLVVADPGGFLFEVNTANMITGPGLIGGSELVLVTVVVNPPETATVFVNTIVGAMKTDGAFVPRVVQRSQNYLGTGLYLNCNPFEGVLFELLLYHRALTTENTAAVNTYLQEKWTCCDG